LPSEILADLPPPRRGSQARVGSAQVPEHTTTDPSFGLPYAYLNEPQRYLDIPK
jgi:hypothetical protein